MRLVTTTKLRRLGIGIATVTLLSLGLALPSAAAPGASTPARAAAPTVAAAAPDYLALGDSVTFGFRESSTVPPPNYAHAKAFFGYPELVGPALGLNVANSACPGETSASFIVEQVQSNGCENSPGGGPGYRTAYPLHVSYSGTQLQYAVAYLTSHPNTQTVSLMIGANDVFLCQEQTTDGCQSELPAVAEQIAANVATILTVIRYEAHYTGRIVLVHYYSLDYTNVTDTLGSEVINYAMDQGATGFSYSIADGFGAFKAAAAHSGGNSCTAGLLTQLSTGGCGVHPSAAGQAILALAVERAIQKSAGA